MTGVTSEGAADRILTIPNAVTVVRLLCVPVFLVLLFGPGNGRYPAAILLGVLGATDWVDGYLARRLHQVSTVGKILDPTADRILLGTAVIAILIDGSVPLPLAIIVLVREVLVAGAALALAAGGARRIDVQWAGKAGTFGLMLAFPLFLVAHSTANWRHVAMPLAWICAIPAVCFGWYSAVTYVPLARRALAEGRAARTAGVAVTPP
ncbi:MAG TPA: CDP-alcohol phosphatidyltransferase family protein [Acidimicrobiales bacterium]|nr:CDP-alcohol phosphatidyltransferase family protein [Acidimicrobiales bacterium]